MRVLRTYTGKVTHLPARNAYEAHEPFPACTPVGTAISNGITRFYFHTAGAVTCKRCLRILEKLVTEAYAMHAAHMMTAEGQAQEDALAARRAEEAGPIDRQVVLATRVDSLLDSGVTDTQRAAELEQEGPLSRQLRELMAAEGARPTCRCTAPGQECTAEDCLNTAYPAPEPKLYTPTGEAMTVLGSAVHGHGLRTGVWGVREGHPLALAFFVDEDHLRLQFSAYRPGERARRADATRLATPLATPSQVAELAAAIAEQAELFAAGGVPARAAEAFCSRMVNNVQTLARWLGMSEPVKLASYAGPYDVSLDLVDGARQAHRSSLEVSSARIVAGVRAARTRTASMPLCRRPSSRWTTYGATCNTPLAADGTCPEQRLHV